MFPSKLLYSKPNSGSQKVSSRKPNVKQSTSKAPQAIKLGSGPRKVIFLHGWFGDETAWHSLTDLIDLKKYTLLMMPYRGCGSAKNMIGEFTIEEIANDALTVADSAGWEKFSLVGHSMGGMAIQKILTKAPHRVLKLYGLTPVPANGYAFDEGTWKFFSSAADDPEVKKKIIDITTGSRYGTSNTWISKLINHVEANTSKGAFSSYLNAWGKTNFSLDIEKAKYTHPFRVMVGQHDPAITKELMENTILQQYKNSTLVIAPNAGHYPQIESPVFVAHDLETYLD